MQGAKRGTNCSRRLCEIVFGHEKFSSIGFPTFHYRMFIERTRERGSFGKEEERDDDIKDARSEAKWAFDYGASLKPILSSALINMESNTNFRCKRMEENRLSTAFLESRLILLEMIDYVINDPGNRRQKKLDGLDRRLDVKVYHRERPTDEVGIDDVSGALNLWISSRAT
uniref:Uncharacterized protein n=1 Tax=Vespula pensylvanica TaxID=30213 RepID=A0A834UHA8_VESPE|nr:hypothetical protein H0235_001505 [Vespula pensylvanica]